jgi:hypothetical protein
VQEGLPDNSIFDDPKACRVQAVKCRQKAEQSTSIGTKEYYSDLAGMWDRMAADLEDAQSFTTVMDEVAASFNNRSKPPSKAA